jgi:hypothetical protein
MSKYIKSKDGKFAGSIGDGKDSVPTAAPSAPQVPVTINLKVKPEYAEKHAAYQRLNERRETARTAMVSLSDSLRAQWPEARYLAFTDDGHPSKIEGYGNAVIWDSVNDAPLPDSLNEQAQTYFANADDYQFDSGYPLDHDGVKAMAILGRCGIDGCNFLTPARGFFPSHEATASCRSGRRPHCTCDTCF